MKPRGGGGFEVMAPQEVMVWAVPSLCGLLLACACPALWRELMHCSKCLVASPNAREFAERQLWNIRGHSALMPAALMIGHHFSISTFCNVASACGVCWSGG